MELSPVTWSYSRRTTLDQCARRYYFDYYGASRRVAASEPHKEEVCRLKKLSNCYLRSGDLAHLAIRLFYREGESSKRWLVDWSRREYRKDYRYSQAAAKGDVSSGSDKRKLLLEFHYGWPDADAVYTKSEERLGMMIETFLTSPAYEEARFGGQRATASVESWATVKTPAFRARGKIDLAYPSAGELTIVDWKTGETQLPAASLQLAFYGLWAVYARGHVADQVTACYGRLSDGVLLSTSLDEATLERGTARILQDLERMHVLDRYGRDGIARAFPTCSSSRVCRLCPYQAICDPQAQ